MPELMCECSRCTGNIVFREQDQVVRCIYCQYLNQRPQATGGTLDKLKRGNRLLQQCRFEEAEDCYEDVLKQYPDEAEALWGRLMCKYGVEVAKEEKYGSVRRYLLCHCARRSSIRNEGDFHDACKYADPLVREQYEKDAEYIDKVQQRIREAAERQESYDVFICYKETDLVTGERTKDSMIAQRLYNRYTLHGYRVFFARETLCDKMGEDYEAAIYQAIATAKVMLVVGLKKEHYQAVWPKSEWMRYLEKTEQGEGLLIPVYGEMKAEELPDQFINMSLHGCCIDTNLSYIEDIESKLYRIIRKPVSLPQESQVRHEVSLLEEKTEALHEESQRQEVPAAVSDKLQEITYTDGKYVGEIVNGKRHGKGVMYYIDEDKYNRVKYDGEWKDDKRHGHGVLIWKNGEKYDGEFKNGQFTGNAVHYYANGDRYEGEFINGKRNGHGVMTWKNGDKYDGEQKDSARHGKGVYYFANGDRYEGDFENGKISGKGVMYYSDEDVFIRVKYDGEWKENKRNGHGVMTWKNGEKYDGEWKDGNRTGQGVYYLANGNRYEGDFEDDKFNGKGVLYYSDEDGFKHDKYDGEWKNGMFNGHGVLTWKSGDKYDGEWKDNKRHGHGVLSYIDGAKYDGEWKEGNRDGQGVFYHSNGDKYDGEWKVNSRTGWGVFYYANGDRYEGEFLEGEFVRQGTLIKRSGRKIRYQDGKPKRFF